MPSPRSKVQGLHRVLDTHAAWERRTMADLRNLGYRFPTVEAAFRYRSAQQTLARMNSEEITELVARLNERSK